MIDDVGCRRELAALGLVAENLMERISGIKDNVESLRMYMLTPEQRAFNQNCVPVVGEIDCTH